MKQIFLFFALFAAVGCSETTPKVEPETIDLAEQLRIKSILTSHYWIISETNHPGYNEEPELSLIYRYRDNGELWCGYNADFQTSAGKAADWTLSGKTLTEIWHDHTFIQEITHISDERLTFVDLFANGNDISSNGYTRIYVPIVIQTQ